MLDDREPEPCASRGPRPVPAIEALEHTVEVFLGDAGAVVRRYERRGALVLFDTEPQRRARPGIAESVFDQVLRDDVEHPGAERDLGVGVACELDRHVRAVGPLLVLGRDALELRERFGLPEGDDDAPALELGEKEDVVDELAHQLDLGTNLVQNRGGV